MNVLLVPAHHPGNWTSFDELIIDADQATYTLMRELLADVRIVQRGR
ncbi:MAG: hypothetical protein H0W21_07370 [Actinobacteria bacterium]|nr:hypothetical protein [Actinomycetota bacterium]